LGKKITLVFFYQSFKPLPEKIRIQQDLQFEHVEVCIKKTVWKLVIMKKIIIIIKANENLRNWGIK
jgi:hypothetical protein